MKVQYLCHLSPLAALMCAVSVGMAAEPKSSEAPAHDYPTLARVEYVNECIAKTGGKLAALYQCACAIDRIANTLTYDDFVEASTFAKYAALPGQGGAIFRDSEQAKALTKNFRELEAAALRGCGMTL